MRVGFSCAAAALLISGCATVPTQGLDTRAGADMKGGTLTHTRRASAQFTIFTPGKAVLGGLFGVVGGAVAGGLSQKEGSDLTTAYGLEDPSQAIGVSLSQALADMHGMQRQPPTLDTVGEDVAQVASSAPGVRYVLDVQTTFWMVSYLPSQWGKYRLLYRALGRLIDTKTRAVVAQAACSRGPDDALPDVYPTYDELMAGQGALIKQETAIAAKVCVDQLRASMFQMSPLPSGVAVMSPVGAKPAPPPVAAAPVPVAVAVPQVSEAQKPATPVQASALEAGMRAGDEFEYLVKDRFTNADTQVTYRVDRIEGDRIFFNQGARIESSAGDVISMASAIGGDMDRLSPPGGWIKGEPRAGARWTARFDKQQADVSASYALTATTTGRSTLATPAGSMEVINVRYSGWADFRRGISLTQASVDVQVAYAPALKRIVRFQSDVEGNGGSGTLLVSSKELTQLVAIRRR